MNKRRTGMRRRLSLYVIAGILAVAASFTLIFFNYFDRLYQERMDHDQLRYTGAAAANAATLLTNIRQNAYTLCCNENLAHALTSQSGDPAAQTIGLISNVFSLNTGAPTTTLMQSAYPYLILDSQFPLASMAVPFKMGSLKNTQHILSSVSCARESWYQSVVALKGQTFAFTDVREDGTLFFAHLLRSIRIADPRFNETIGVVVYAMPEMRFSQLLAAGQVNSDSTVLFAYKDTVLCHTGPDILPAGSDLSALPAIPRQGTVGFVAVGEGDFLVSRSVIQGDWQCVVLTPRHSIMSGGTPYALLIAVVLIAVLVILLFSLLISRRVVWPITRLSDVMERAQDVEHMPPAGKSAGWSEISVLYESYDAMRRRIQALSQETQEEQEKLRASEIKAMQAQINPHFIYNTLDSISCSALLEGNDDIVTMVESLIGILKYSIQFSRTTVPLREELEYLKSYIRIQQIRYANGFKYEEDVAEDVKNALLPPVTLQPLVENALFHAESDGPRMICVSSETAQGPDGPVLILHVTDNGAHVEAQQLNALLCAADADEKSGIGIRNVSRRISLLFGPSAGLFYTNPPQGGLDAAVRLPLTNDPQPVEEKP